MQTQVNVDSELLQRAVQSSGATDAESAVEEALRFFADVRAQQGIRALRGTVQWEGDLDETRANRFPD